MTVEDRAAPRSFVLVALGGRRYALPTASVAELVAPGPLLTLPHTTPLVSGVLVRRGRIVPVCDIAQALIGPGGSPRKFYLIVAGAYGSADEWIAVPVSGECELMSGEPLAPSQDLPPYVSGLLPVGSETVQILNLEALSEATAAGPAAASGGNPPEAGR